MLDARQVRSTFVSDIDRGYVVIEVGIFPEKGQRVDVSASDFVLRGKDTKTQARAATPAEIARILQKTAPTERSIDVYPTVGVGYESGRGYDSMTGSRRGGVYTSTGVGVGVGSSRPVSTDADRKTMEQELTEKSLPEGEAAAPACGYLYFPLNPKRKGPLELEYRGLNQRVLIELK